MENIGKTRCNTRIPPRCPSHCQTTWKGGEKRQEPGKATKSGKSQEELAQVCKIRQRQAARLGKTSRLGKAATNCQKPRLVILSITRKRLLHRTHLINKKYCHTGTVLLYRQILSRSTIHFARGWPIRVMRNYCKKSVALDNLCNDSQHHLVLK